MHKRESGLKKAKEMEEISGFLPPILLRETEALSNIRINDIMTKNVTFVSQNTTVHQFLDLVAKCQHAAYPMVNESNELVGWITLEEASTVDKNKREETLVSKIARRKVITAYSDETASDAFKKMSENEVGRVLILDRSDPKKILGIVTKTDLMNALANQ